jgi:hypothetical protein
VAAIKERLRHFKDRIAHLLPFRRRPGFVPHIARLGKLEECYGCNPKALDAAVQYFGLDAASVGDRELLVYILADVVFGGQRGRPKGSKTAWDSDRLLQLFRAYEQCKSASPALSDSALANQIADTKEFSKNSVNQIRQHLGAAKAANRAIDEDIKRLGDRVKALAANRDLTKLDLGGLIAVYDSFSDLVDFAYEQCKSANPALSDSALAKRIADTKEFSKNSVDQIRQQLGSAKAANRAIDEDVKELGDGLKARAANRDLKKLDLGG